MAEDRELVMELLRANRDSWADFLDSVREGAGVAPPEAVERGLDRVAKLNAEIARRCVVPELREPTFAQTCVFTAAEWNGRWWLDRVRINEGERKQAVTGPFPDELAALRRANEMNRLNQGWAEAE
jgi:hypothetical protein